MRRRHSLFCMSMAAVASAASPQLGQQVDYWGGVQYAETINEFDPLATADQIGRVLNTQDEVGALIEFAGAAKIRVDVFLHTLLAFDPASCDLKIRLREFDDGGTVPGPVISGTEVSLSVADEDWQTAGWYSTVIDTSAVAPGSYWVCLYAVAAPTDDTLRIIIERDDDTTHNLTWEDNSDSWIDRDGLWYSENDTAWEANGPDPYIRMLPKVDTGGIIDVSGVDANFKTGVADVDNLVLYAEARSSEGPGAIENYRWVYRVGDDPTEHVWGGGAVEPGDIIDDYVNIEYTVGQLEDGVYHFYCQVQDQTNSWLPEGNNIKWPGTAYVVPEPPPTPGLTAELSELRDNCGSDICTFVGQLGFVGGGNPEATIPNEYSVQLRRGTTEVTEYVRFEIEKPNGTVEKAIDVYQPDEQHIDRFYAEFEMRDLATFGEYKIRAIARGPTDNDQHTLEETLIVLAPPRWYTAWLQDGAPNVNDIEVRWLNGDEKYRFRGDLPYPEIDESEQLDMPVWGDRRNKGELSGQVRVYYDLEGTITKAGTGSVYQETMSHEVIHSDVDMVDTDEEQKFIISYQSPTSSFDGLLYHGVIWSGYIAGFPVTLDLDVDYVLSVAFNICAALNRKLQLKPICLTPQVVPGFLIDLSVDFALGVAESGVEGAPEFSIDFPMCYYYKNDPEVYMNFSLQFDFQVRAYLCGAWGATCVHSPWFQPDGLPWQWEYWQGPGPEECDAARSETNVPTREIAADQPEPLSPFENPRIATDTAGNSLAVWIHDNNRDTTDPPDPDVYYSYYNGVFWSQPRAVHATPLRFETDPQITFLSPGNNALLVVTQNQLTPNQAEQAQNSNDILIEQELVSYRFIAPSFWIPDGKVHNDAAPYADGRSQISERQHPNPHVVWVRDPDQDVAPPVNSNIMTSRWNNNSWSSKVSLRSGDEAFMQPHVAIDQTGTKAMAVWVRDDDGYADTGDRVIEASYFDGANWRTAFEAVNSLVGVLWPNVGFDSDGRPFIVFTSRGNEWGEGAHDYLYTATRASGVAAHDPSPFEIIKPMGGPKQNRARWPRITVAHTPTPLAFVGARAFTGAGPGGFAGDVGIVAKLLDSNLDASDHWPALQYVTDDDVLDWKVDVSVSNATNELRAVWINPDSYLPAQQNPPFGHGFDGIKVLEIQLEPDLSITPEDIGISTNFAEVDQALTISAKVANKGLKHLPVPVNVGFYLVDDGIPSLLGQVPIDQLAAGRTITVPRAWISDGLPHVLRVVVDDGGAVAESDETNNQAEIPLCVNAPPVDLTISANLIKRTFVLNWESPQMIDTSAPLPALYKVYREDTPGGGFVEVVETPGRIFVDPVAPGISASYYVTSVTSAGTESLPSEVVFEVMPMYGDDDLDRVANPHDNCPDHFNPWQEDCDQDGTGDVCQLAQGSSDCDANGVPDECQPDCNGNLVTDACEPDHDCNSNSVPDECEGSGDGDHDCTVDINDWALFSECLDNSGPDVTYPGGLDCIYFDMDLDDDVDAQDMQQMVDYLGSPGPSAACDNPQPCSAAAHAPVEFSSTGGDVAFNGPNPHFRLPAAEVSDSVSQTIHYRTDQQIPLRLNRQRQAQAGARANTSMIPQMTMRQLQPMTWRVKLYHNDGSVETLPMGEFEFDIIAGDVWKVEAAAPLQRLDLRPRTGG